MVTESLRVRVLAPAKVNLILRIVSRRADGYHLLDSVMAPVSLYDEVQVTVERRAAAAAHIRVDCDAPGIPTDASNLAHRAAALVCREFGIRARVAVSLRKRIPAGAGLGGGSSDAAAVLTALDRLFDLGLPTDRLSRLAVRLGADVPFFLCGGPARVSGIGEVVARLPALPRRWLVIVVPPFAVSTAWAYQQFDRQRRAVSHVPVAGWDRAFDAGRWPTTPAFVNDLERAVLPAHPELAERKARLLALGAHAALMSGSGSAVFGVFAREVAAAQAATALSDAGRVHVVRLLAGAADQPPPRIPRPTSSGE